MKLGSSVPYSYIDRTRCDSDASSAESTRTLREDAVRLGGRFPELSDFFGIDGALAGSGSGDAAGVTPMTVLPCSFHLFASSSIRLPRLENVSLSGDMRSSSEPVGISVINGRNVPVSELSFAVEGRGRSKVLEERLRLGERSADGRETEGSGGVLSSWTTIVGVGSRAVEGRSWLTESLAEGGGEEKAVLPLGTDFNELLAVCGRSDGSLRSLEECREVGRT